MSEPKQPWNPGELEELVRKLILRLHRANKRNTGIRLDLNEVGELAYALNNTIADYLAETTQDQ